MNAEVNINYIKYISQEMQEQAGQAAKLLAGLEDVEYELRKQSVLSPFLRNLGMAKKDIAEEKYKLNTLAQALANIGSQYGRTEQRIEDGFNGQVLARNRVRAGTVDVARLNDRVNSLLYGGEGEWQA